MLSSFFAACVAAQASLVPATLTVAQQHDLFERIAALLRAEYVTPQTGNAAALRAAAKQGVP
jgi:hypothetical protein